MIVVRDKTLQRADLLKLVRSGVQVHCLDCVLVGNLGGIRFSDWYFHKCFWQEVSLRGAGFDKCDFFYNVFLSGDLSGAKFTRCEFDACVFLSSLLKGASFVRSEILSSVFLYCRRTISHF